MPSRKLAVAVSVAVAAGLLEAAWTNEIRGGPANLWLGVIALLVAFLVVSFPRIWWIPAMAILEEWVHLTAGYGIYVPDLTRVLDHWSHAHIGFPLMPYITFPALTITGEILYRKFTTSVRRGLDEQSSGFSNSVGLLFQSNEREVWAQNRVLPDLAVRVVNPPVQASHLNEALDEGPHRSYGEYSKRWISTTSDEEQNHRLKGRSADSEDADD